MKIAKAIREIEEEIKLNNFTLGCKDSSTVDRVQAVNKIMGLKTALEIVKKNIGRR